MDAAAFADVVKQMALLAICTLSFSIRLFSVIKYESVIHEFDPYFNYRVTQFLTKEGFYDTWNWFDTRTWYPLGRVVGGTMYPIVTTPRSSTWLQGLIWTAGTMYKILHALNIPIHVQEVCVFTAPLFSSLCALASYGFVKEIRGSGAGLVAAAFVGIVPSYISRSVAGSYDLEGVAIFALMFVFYLYVKTLNTGSLAWATALAASYLYMVLSWGGYVFIVNLLPIHCLVSVFTGRLTTRLYVAYAPIVVMGTLLAASVPVIGFNAVLMSEHFAAFLAFGVLHVAMAVKYIKRLLPEAEFKQAQRLVITGGIASGCLVAAYGVARMLASPTFGWSGRSLTLLDPTYASKYIPIVASVSEHQPPAWNAYFTDINMMVMLMPIGFVLAFRPLTDASLFLVLYGCTAVYFSGVMVRLMLVLAPAACCLSAIAASEVFSRLSASVVANMRGTNVCIPASQSSAPGTDVAPGDSAAGGAVASSKSTLKSAMKKGGKASKGAGFTMAPSSKSPTGSGGKKERPALPMDVSIGGIVLLASMIVFYTAHCVWVSAEMYSAPSIVLQSRNRDGSVKSFDDFREAYAWLRYNTAEDAKVASWWDYGYQTTAMANRTVMVDNNTWNNTHIATVGRAMASGEKKAWHIYRSLDVDYVLVVFGGYIGYPSDDVNKFLWMVRIAQGEFSDIKESNYIGPRGYTVDASAPPALLDSLVYKLSYYGYAAAAEKAFGQKGLDRVRNVVIGKEDIRLKHFEEVFTSEHWMVRIYRLKPPAAREPRMVNPLRVTHSSKPPLKPRLPSGAAR